MPRYKVEVPEHVMRGIRAWNLPRSVSRELLLSLAERYENWPSEPAIDSEHAYAKHVNFSDNEAYVFNLKLIFVDGKFSVVQCNMTVLLDGIPLWLPPVDED